MTDQPAETTMTMRELLAIYVAPDLAGTRLYQVFHAGQWRTVTDIATFRHPPGQPIPLQLVFDEVFGPTLTEQDTVTVRALQEPA